MCAIVPSAAASARQILHLHARTHACTHARAHAHLRARWRLLSTQLVILLLQSSTSILNPIQNATWARANCSLLLLVMLVLQVLLILSPLLPLMLLALLLILLLFLLLHKLHGGALAVCEGRAVRRHDRAQLWHVHGTQVQASKRFSGATYQCTRRCTSEHHSECPSPEDCNRVRAVRRVNIACSSQVAFEREDSALTNMPTQVLSPRDLL